MWTTESRRITSATRQRLWQLWVDVPNWKVWDTDVREARLNGGFAVGTTGTMQPSNGPTVKFMITECSQLSSFTSRSVLPLCTMDFIHTLNETPQGLEVVHRVEMHGLLTPLFSRVIGKNIEKGLPETVKSLVALAEAL
ncbi:MAG: hypothetical protein ACK5H0_08035 [Bacteroidota bacterium]|jgi:hypothetical protein